MPPGSLLLFRGDTVHAGAAYAADNVRLHVYLDYPGFSPDKNMTGALVDMELPDGKSAECLFSRKLLRNLSSEGAVCAPGSSLSGGDGGGWGGR